MKTDNKWRRCCWCGLYVSYSDIDQGKVVWEDPTRITDMEPREAVLAHKVCPSRKKEEILDDNP